MTIQQKARLACMVLISGVVLSACSTNRQNPAYPTGDMTMTQIYSDTAGHQPLSYASDESYQNITELRGQLGIELMPKTRYVAYTRDAENEVNTLFQPLDNPQVPVYVYPHLALLDDDEVPVPGYTTAFFLYKKDQYAMPTEKF